MRTAVGQVGPWVIGILMSASGLAAAPVSTAFTYQGTLEDGDDSCSTAP